MDILFTGGACPEAKPIEGLDLSRLRCTLLKQKNNYYERSSGPTTARYSKKVLVGNWCEERVAPPADLENDWTTDYGASYKTHDSKNLIEDLYTVWKNKQKTQGFGRKLVIDNESYENNMTSTYDLSFRVLSRGLCGPRVRVYNSRTNTWEPETDLALSYGNQTKHGLVDAVKRKTREDESYSPLKSIYQFDYIEKWSQRDSNGKRFLKAHADMNTPDLRHLGIDLSSPSKPPFREPQCRRSRCEKVCTWL